jgi:predicted phage terminase large subunit-like protein
LPETTLRSFKLTDKQTKANQLLGGPARHVMLYGGSRSGKSFIIVRAMVIRALACKSRHAALRYRFNHIKGSLVYDTLPKVMELCFPDVAQHCHLDKTDWFYSFPNGSEIWFGGLDDKERTEKILGQEYATLFMNECSQIPWSSRNIAITRLAQNTEKLRLKAYYDCNPPAETHWTCRAFMDHVDPDTRVALRDREAYDALLMNPGDNQENLPRDYLRELESLPDRMRRRFLLGQFGSAQDNALWSYALIDKCRQIDSSLPDFARVVIAVDPSGCAGEEDKRSDEVGIVVLALGTNGKAYVVEDLSGRFGPSEWGATVVAAVDRHEADAVVAEVNFGGAMVASVIRAAEAAVGEARRRIPVKEVHASRGKAIRAEPISTLYEQGKVIHVGYFEMLEEQMCSMTTAGYAGDRSPDRLDALVWGLTELFPAMTRRETIASRGPLPSTANMGYAKLKAGR